MARPKSRVSNVRLAGPLAPFADAYTAKLRAQAYTPLTIVNQLRQVARLSCWLDASGLTVPGLTDEVIDEFLAFQRAGCRDRGSWSRPGLLCLLEVLREQGVLAATESPPPSPAQVLMSRFERYLLCERGLSLAPCAAM